MRFRLTLAVLAAVMVLPAPALARDPGRWLLTGFTEVPITYWQGVTSSPGSLFFSGPVQGASRTRLSLRQVQNVEPVIPAAVLATEGYNHVGDISYDRAEGGRVLLPLECYQPGGPNGGNTCGTGSIGLADPATLAFRYYVKLDPAEIPKAMWVERSPDGKLLWTSSGDDLLAYRAADVSLANAGPGAAPIHAARRLRGAVPPSGVTGAAFHRGRLLLAGASGTTFQVWSVDTATGKRRLEVEMRRVRGESEGLHITSLLNGQLHWLIAPPVPNPTFGPEVGLLHFARKTGRAGLSVRARATAALRKPRLAVRVTLRGQPVRGASVTVADARGRTDARGRATLAVSAVEPGDYAVLARRGRLRGLSKRFHVASDGAAGARGAAAASRPLR